MVWIETPTNPLLKLVDIKGAAKIVHEHEVSLLPATQTLTMIKLVFRLLHKMLCNLAPQLKVYTENYFIGGLPCGG